MAHRGATAAGGKKRTTTSAEDHHGLVPFMEQVAMKLERTWDLGVHFCQDKIADALARGAALVLVPWAPRTKDGSHQ